MSRWKLVVGMTVGLALLGCGEKPPVVPPIEPPVDVELQKADDLVKEGEALLVEDKLDEAEAKANEALELKPEHEGAKELLDKVKEEKRKKEEARIRALTVAGRAEEAKKKQIAESFRAAQGLLDRKAYDAAIAAAEKVLELDAAHAGAKNLIAKAKEEKAKTDVATIKERKIEELGKKGSDARARRQWKAAKELYKQLAALTTGRAKARAQDRVRECEAKELADDAQRIERTRPLEALKKYDAALKIKYDRDIKRKKDRLAENIRLQVKAKADRKRFDEGMKMAQAYLGRGEKQKALDKLREIARIRVPGVVKATSMAAKLTKEINFDKQVKAASDALAKDPPDYAAAVQALTDAKPHGTLSAELEGKLRDCQSYVAEKGADTASEAGELPDAVEGYVKALSLIKDEEEERKAAVTAKLEEVRDLKAGGDVDSLLASVDERLSAEKPEYEQAVNALDVAVGIVKARPNAFDPKKLGQVEKKLATVKGKWTAFINKELVGKYKEVVVEWKRLLREDARGAVKYLEDQKATFENSKYARGLDKLLKKSNAMVTKSAAKEYNKVSKKVARSKDYEANIQLLKDLIESGKLTGSKYEQMATDLLDAQKKALEEAPPAPPEEPAPPEPVLVPEPE